MNDTNVGLGMVPCKKGCHCHDCTVDRLNARIKELEAQLSARDALQGDKLYWADLGPSLAESPKNPNPICFSLVLLLE